MLWGFPAAKVHCCFPADYVDRVPRRHLAGARPLSSRCSGHVSGACMHVFRPLTRAEGLAAPSCRAPPFQDSRTPRAVRLSSRRLDVDLDPDLTSPEGSPIPLHRAQKSDGSQDLGLISPLFARRRLSAEQPLQHIRAARKTARWSRQYSTNRCALCPMHFVHTSRQPCCVRESLASSPWAGGADHVPRELDRLSGANGAPDLRHGDGRRHIILARTDPAPISEGGVVPKELRGRFAQPRRSIRTNSQPY